MLEKIKHFAISFAATIIVSYLLFGFKLISTVNETKFFTPLLWGGIIWLIFNSFWILMCHIFLKALD